MIRLYILNYFTYTTSWKKVQLFIEITITVPFSWSSGKRRRIEQVNDTFTIFHDGETVCYNAVKVYP